MKFLTLSQCKKLTKEQIDKYWTKLEEYIWEVSTMIESKESEE